MSSLFITLEGGEGVGKSTVSAKLQELLSNNEITSILTREPGGTKLSEKIRTLIMNNKMSKKTELLLFNAARSEHMEHINKSLKEYDVVICDRFIDSTLVYQTTQKGTLGIVWDVNALKEKHVKMVNEFTINGRFPDITFILDMDADKAQERLKNNDRKMNRFDKEDIEFHRTIRDKFLDLSTTGIRYKVIDADKSVDEIALEMYNYIKGILNIE